MSLEVARSTEVFIVDSVDLVGWVLLGLVEGWDVGFNGVLVRHLLLDVILLEFFVIMVLY